MPVSKEQAINTAIDWWCQWFEKTAPQNAGDEGGAIGMMLTMINLSQRKAVEPEQVVRFKQFLRAAIERDIAGRDDCRLRVDYSPEDTLKEACDAARIPGGYFPIKTVVWIEPNKVIVRCGYGAQEKVLYPVQEQE